MKINHSYKGLLDEIELGNCGYLEIQGHEGRDPEKRLYIRTYESKESYELREYYHLLEEQRQPLKEVAAKHNIEVEELPDRETKTAVQREFELWMTRTKEKGLQGVSRYEKAKEVARELASGVERGFWKNEVANVSGFIDLTRSAQRTNERFNPGRDRQYQYLTDRIGHGGRTGQSYTSKRGVIRYHGNSEIGDIDSMISTMVGFGLLRKLDKNNIYELTGQAFDLLRIPSWFEKYHSKVAFWVSIAAAVLSIALMPQRTRHHWGRIGNRPINGHPTARPHSARSCRRLL